MNVDDWRRTTTALVAGSALASVLAGCTWGPPPDPAQKTAAAVPTAPVQSTPAAPSQSPSTAPAQSSPTGRHSPPPSRDWRTRAQMAHPMNVPDRVIMEQLRNAAQRIANHMPLHPKVPSDVTPGTNRALGYQLMTEFGFGPEQWPALNALWTRESGWNQFAQNGRSGAYGIPQALPAQKMSVVGPDWHTNPETQIRWGLAYIAARYHSPDAAWRHSQRFGWY